MAELDDLAGPLDDYYLYHAAVLQRRLA